MIGRDIKTAARELAHYGADEIYVYDHTRLEYFLAEPYTNMFENFINAVKPSAVLIGATSAGRSLAPRVAARMSTGLTADCTRLDIDDDGGLIQIRPAFGGDIMAHICTPNHRPQIATVRYKIFDAPQKNTAAHAKIIYREIESDKLISRVRVVNIVEKEKIKSISEADVIVAAGRGIKSEKDMALADGLAALLNAETASTRPLAEAGWIAPNRQIGLSGRTVKPKLIITLGVSGSVQFRAGMENSDLIIAVNSDENADIFDYCHYAVVGDLYEIVPELIRLIKEHKGGGGVNV
jgi:electron transfer flavoprotein alpha subunit